MFKLKSSIKEMVSPKELVTVEEIHNEFDTAVDSIIEEAKEILSKANQEDKETASQLENLGFTKLGLVKRYKELNEKEKESQELAKYSLMYKERYGLKFISERLVKNICQKYGLIIGATSDFIGEIPLKNRKELLDFKLQDVDKSWGFYYWFYREYIWTEANSKEAAEEKRKEFASQNLSALSVQTKNDFKIVGTIDQFDLKDKIISDYEIKSKDPIVLMEVKGGYLIITKWGAEENIEEIK